MAGRGHCHGGAQPRAPFFHLLSVTINGASRSTPGNSSFRLLRLQHHNTCGDMSKYVSLYYIHKYNMYNNQ